MRSITCFTSRRTQAILNGSIAFLLRSLFLIFGLFFFATSNPAIADESDASFVAGVQAYKSADFESAATSFRQSGLLRPGSGTFQNLGLAEWHDNHVGPAVLAWEQALWLDPFNKAVRNNLRFARKAAQVDAPDLAWYEVISGWLPGNWWSWIISSSLWLAVGAVVLPMVLRRPRAFWHQALAAFGLMLFLLSLPAQVGVHTRTNIGFVLDKGTPLRLTPTQEAQSLTQLSPGEPVRWLRARANFILVRTSRATGWIEKSSVGLLCEQQAKQMTKVDDRRNDE